MDRTPSPSRGPEITSPTRHVGSTPASSNIPSPGVGRPARVQRFTGHGFLVISTVMEAQPGGRRVTVKSHLPKTEILRICSFGRHSSPELEALSRGALTPTPRSERSAALVSTAQFRLRITCIPRGTGPRSRASRAGSRGPSCRRCEGRTGRASRCRGRSERAPRAA